MTKSKDVGCDKTGLTSWLRQLPYRYPTELPMEMLAANARKPSSVISGCVGNAKRSHNPLLGKFATRRVNGVTWVCRYRKEL
jgi:hypothetical protein